MVGDAFQCPPGIGQRQQVVEEDVAMARPGEMLGERLRLIAVDEPAQTPQMLPVEASRAPDRKTDAVQGQRVALADGGELGMGQTALAHIVLGMDLEEANVRAAAQYVVDVLRLQAGPSPVRQPAAGAVGDRGIKDGNHVRVSALSWEARGPGPAGRVREGDQLGRLMAVREPGPNGVDMVRQVPLGTSFQDTPL